MEATQREIEREILTLAFEEDIAPTGFAEAYGREELDRKEKPSLMFDDKTRDPAFTQRLLLRVRKNG